ncbi:MAG: putative lipid II flippase FtsW [Clostridia bacterium]|nr:putative lipid II flippase FtsW [Clostridia bacterium]
MSTKVKKTSKFMNNPFDFILCIVVFILLSLGIVMVLSASAPSALAEGGESYEYAGKQLLFGILGIVAMFIISKIDYRFYKKFYWAIYGFSIIILLMVLIPKMGVNVNGATRWVAIPGIGQFQPSELTKIGLIIFFAGYLSDHKNEMKDFWKGFIRPFVFIIPPIAVLYFVQNHLSASLIIAMITCVMVIIAGARMLYFICSGVAGGGAIGAYLLYKINSGGGEESFRINRIISFMDPWADATDTGWQVVQSLYAIGSGGLFGTGLGGSKQKYLYISEPQNDFIFSIIAEELGFVGCTIIMALFAIFIWRGILIAMKAPDTFGGLLAVGITSLVAIQVILNIAVVTSSMPNTGIPLPFFSAGGTALFILLCSVRYFTKYFTSRAERIKFNYISNYGYNIVCPCCTLLFLCTQKQSFWYE